MIFSKKFTLLTQKVIFEKKFTILKKKRYFLNSLQKLNKYQQDSLKTGNAGNRIACGNIIEVSAGTEWAQAYRL